MVGAVSSLGALVFALYALAYAGGDVRFGGDDYGCDDPACAAAHVAAALVCLGSVAVYALLLAMAPFRSLRMLRAGVRLGLAWAATMVAVGLLAGWPGLGLLAPAPALMATGSWMRSIAKRRQLNA